MIWEQIHGSLSTASEQALVSQKHYFRSRLNGSYKFDGPTAAFLLMESVNPNTHVSVISLKKQICEAHLGGLNHNIWLMVTSIQSNYTEIKEFGGSHNNIVMDTSLPCCPPRKASSETSSKERRTSGKSIFGVFE